MSESVVDASVVPGVLRECGQWVCWRAEERDGKVTKVPVVPGGGFGSATDPSTWVGFDDAVECVEMGGADGVGFVFTEGDAFVGVDLDDCRDPETGVVDDGALDIIERLDSYTEVSPSGTGFHVLLEGELPEGRNRRGSVEMYDRARFFTVTGDLVEGAAMEVVRRQDALDAVHREYVQADASGESGSGSGSGSAGGAGECGVTSGESGAAEAGGSTVDLEDEELLSRARGASNGEKFERLWNGRIGGYESQSEADMALCCLLAFWTGGDEVWMDRLFRQSGLLREKWDEVHYADGSTYGEKTVERAVETTSEFYEPDGSDGDEDVADTAASDDRSEGAVATGASEAADVDTQSGSAVANTSDGVTATGSASTTESSAASSGRAGGGTERSRAYVAEKNRLLRERVDELEVVLEEKRERITELEGEVERLREALAARDNEDG